MADAVYVRPMDESKITLLAAVQPGEVWQLKDGRVGIYNPTIAGASGDRALFTTSGKFTFTKATGFVGLDGGRAYWDHSANNVTYKKVNDRDYYLGRLVGDSATGDTTCVVDINVDPCYDIDLNEDPFLSTIVGTAAAGGFGYPVRLGGSNILELTATNEAQKVDLISRDGFAVGANAIVEGAFLILSDGSNATQDFNIGIANGTHASDADAIAEAVFLHIDGNSTNINVESDDGTTDSGSIDSTVDYTEGSAVAQRVEFWMDLRDPADIQVYINGSLVLGASTFTLSAATGPMFLLAHLEKSSSTDTYKVAVDWLRVRFSEQNAS